MSLCLVVPCFNEAERLPVYAFQTFLQSNPRISILFVNDGSSDQTQNCLEKLVSPFENASLLHLKKNVGKAEAVRQGLLVTLKHGHTFVGYWDADLATPMGELPRFEKILQSNAQIHFVMGARVKLLGRRIERHLWRHYLGRVFATIASSLFNLGVYDTQCGAKLMRVTPLLHKCLEQPFLSRWIFDLELIQRLRRNIGEHVFYELPLMAWKDVAGSKVRPKDFFVAFFELMYIRLVG